MSDAQAWQQGLLAVIRAESATAKAAALALLPPACPGEPGVLPALPGRPAAWRIAEDGSGRRRAGLAAPGARRRFLHAIFHIELSAIDLACAVALSAGPVPVALLTDLVAIAREEAVHAQLLAAWLERAGTPPGTFPVHHRLWQALRACQDLGERLVVVPRYLEARGLDVAQAVLPRLTAADPEAGAILARIYRDEIGHVGTGTRWHTWWCAAHQLDPEAHYAAIVRRRFPEQLPSPFRLDWEGRRAAGFRPGELALLAPPAG